MGWIVLVALLGAGCGGSDAPSRTGADFEEQAETETASDVETGQDQDAGENTGPDQDADQDQDADENTAPDPEAADTVEAPRPEIGTVVLLEPGVEPRVQLGFGDPTSRRVTVEVVESSAGSVGGEAVDVRRAAEFVVDVTLEPNPDGALVSMTPTVTAFDIATPLPTDRQLGPLEWSLDQNGQLIEVNGPSLLGTPLGAAASMLSMPELFAVVPTDPVGVGATWRYALSKEGVFSVELTAIDDQTFDVTVTFVRSVGQGTISFEVTGVYDRQALLAVAVASRLDADIVSETSRTGEVVDIAGTYTVERVYTAQTSS